jgi:hypothetical protein
MLPVGHVAYTWATLVWLQAHGRAGDVDLRAAAIAALFPDLVDKPVSLTLLSNSGTSQGLAHTLLVQSTLSVVTALARPEWLPYALISNSHLVADQMWKYPHTLLFPFSRKLDSWKYMGSPSAMLSAYAEIVARPSILAVEMVGVALLLWAVRGAKPNTRRSWRHLLATGRLQPKTIGQEQCE